MWVLQKPNGREKNIENTEKINTFFQPSEKLEFTVYIQNKTIYTLPLRLFIQIFRSMCIASTGLWFVSLQNSTEELEDGEVMNGMQTELLTSPKTMDALRYSIYVNKNILFQLNVFFKFIVVLFYRKDQDKNTWVKPKSKINC